MNKVLALDLTCLFLAPLRRAPRGIDRVELAYAEHFLKNWPSDCVGVLPTPWGVRYFDRARSLRGVETVKELWRENLDASQDGLYKRVKQFISGVSHDSNIVADDAGPLHFRKTLGFLRIVSRAGFSFGRSCVRQLPKHAIYLNVGQLSIYRAFFWWLARRPDILSVFMVHDVIPIEYPDYHTSAGVKMHYAIMKNVAEFANALIVPSASARDSIQRELAKLSGNPIPAHVELLPVPSPFLSPATVDLDLAKGSYFLVCGVIDAHKNHILLLKVWEKLVSMFGRSTPKLVIAGAIEATSAPTLDFLSQCKSIQDYVLVCTGLSTSAIRKLMMSARAVLMPSLAEGFGLPIVEALAQGTLVIASDIPAHREAGMGGEVIFAEASNVDLWVSCIQTVLRNATKAKQQSYKCRTWHEYFAGIDQFLQSLAYSSMAQPVN